MKIKQKNKKEKKNLPHFTKFHINYSFRKKKMKTSLQKSSKYLLQHERYHHQSNRFRIRLKTKGASKYLLVVAVAAARGEESSAQVLVHAGANSLISLHILQIINNKNTARKSITKRGRISSLFFT